MPEKRSIARSLERAAVRLETGVERYGSVVIRFTTIALIFVCALIGLLFVTRGTAVQRVRGVGADGMPVSPGEPSFPLSVTVLTGASLLQGNRIEIAINGDETYPRLWNDLRGAQRSITVQMYYANKGAVADSLASVLIERAHAGVVVLLLYDAFGSELPREYIHRLTDGGVHAVAFRPLRFRNLWIVQNRSHIRGIVIDGRVGWTGGFGIDDKWLGNARGDNEWRDTNVRFEGPAVLQLEAAFVAAWSEATGELLTGRATITKYDDGVARAGLLFTAPTLGSTPAERYLALSIAGARQRLYVTNAYFAPDTNFIALLARAARHGVDVRILVGGPKTDVRVARLAAHARYEALLASGVKIYEYQPTTLHAKTFVADGTWVSIGTMNFDNRSLALNDESTLMVLDSAVGRKMEAIFFDDLGKSVEIDLPTFRKRPFTDRIAEWGANLITRLL
jgi:cardiolipin synthase